mgnify:CR=1 FL=1
MLIQGSFLSSLLNLLPQKGMVKMVDCAKTENYFVERLRMTKRRKIYGNAYMCKIDCANCPLNSLNNGTNDMTSCSDFEALYPEKAIAIVQKWSDEHPPKTYLSEFLKHYPNVKLRDDGTPEYICPRYLGLAENHTCNDNCVRCWNQPIEEDEE